jgi:serine O-acetyltransferase
MVLLPFPSGGGGPAQRRCAGLFEGRKLSLCSLDPQPMFENIREDYEVHGRSLKNRAFWAMLTYRYGRWSLAQRVGFLRWITGKLYGLLYLLCEILTGVHMPREVTIGRRFHIVHADGSLSIHPDTVIGDRVGVMHNVTIGTNMSDAVPVIGNDVFIGVGAAILGGVKIGDGARIAANSLVITDVPPHSVAMGVPARSMKIRSEASAPKPDRSRAKAPGLTS